MKTKFCVTLFLSSELSFLCSVRYVLLHKLVLREIKMSGPGLEGIDALTSAMVTNIIPDQEYLLQVIFSLGSIPGIYSLVGTTVFI